ncbi:MAG: hypothetical protein Kow0067_00140 [Coriobacteriia bacterium]|jgi:hypothetical protein|nr:hypothetical protein [Anaerosomatales bacterium]
MASRSRRLSVFFVHPSQWPWGQFSAGLVAEAAFTAGIGLSCAALVILIRMVAG